MYAELQTLSPLVPTREAHFLRCCQQNADEGSWTVVDFPIDSFHDSLQHSFPRYRRKPSGCIIQDMPNGYSRVIISISPTHTKRKPFKILLFFYSFFFFNFSLKMSCWINHRSTQKSSIQLVTKEIRIRQHNYLKNLKP